MGTYTHSNSYFFQSTFFHFLEDEAAEAESCSSNGRAVAKGHGGENEERVVSAKKITQICEMSYSGANGRKKWHKFVKIFYKCEEKMHKFVKCPF